MLRSIEKQRNPEVADPMEILEARLAVLEQRADNTDRDLLGLWALSMAAKRLAGRLVERVAGFGVVGRN